MKAVTVADPDAMARKIEVYLRFAGCVAVVVESSGKRWTVNKNRSDDHYRTSTAQETAAIEAICTELRGVERDCGNRQDLQLPVPVRRDPPLMLIYGSASALAWKSCYAWMKSE